MTKNRILWIVVAIVLLVGATIIIPSSPLYLGKLLDKGTLYDGHPKSYWIDALNSPDRDVRISAIAAMGAMGTEAGESVPALAKIMIEDSDKLVRNEAALALSKMAPASAAAVPALAQALEDKESLIRINACFALLRLKTEARSALPALIRALKDENNQSTDQLFHVSVQELAARAVGRATSGTADGVPALLEALSSAHTVDLRIAVARGLGDIGVEARSAAPQLRALLKDKSKLLQQAAEEALQSVGVDPKDAERQS